MQNASDELYSQKYNPVYSNLRNYYQNPSTRARFSVPNPINVPSFGPPRNSVQYNERYWKYLLPENKAPSSSGYYYLFDAYGK